MALNFTQTDTTAPLGVIQACSPVAPTGDADAREGVVGGTAGVTANAAAIPAASKVTVHCDELRIADGDSLDGGPLTYRLNVSTAQPNLTLEDIYVCRVNSSGVSQETLGSSTGLGIDISASGVFTPPDITLSAASAHNAGDRIYITVAVANSHSMTSRSLEVLPNQNIDTPFTASGISGSGGGLLGTLAAVGVAAALIAGSGSPSLPALSASGAGAVSPTLTRTHSGLLHVSRANHADHPFDVADWEEQENCSPVSVDGATGGLDLAGTTSWFYLRLSATASRAKRMVQAVFEVTGPGSGVREIHAGGHLESGVAGNQMAGAWATVQGATEFAGVREREGFTSVSTTNASAVTAKVESVQYRITGFVDDDFTENYDFDSGTNLSKALTNFFAGWAGISAQNNGTYRLHEFWDTEDRPIVCTGLPTGHKLKVRGAGGAVLKSATETTGTASLDLIDVSLAAIVDVVVTDASDVVLVSFVPDGVTENYIAGGDTFSFQTTVSGSGAPSLPALTGGGSGEVAVEGAGAPSLPALSSTGAGAVLVQGTGTATLPALAGAGAGAVAVTGTGSPALPALTATGTATALVQGTGAPSLTAMQATGAGIVSVAGTGAAALPALTATGAGTVTVEGSGSPSLPALSGTGTDAVDSNAISGSGSPVLPALAGSGAGAVLVEGTGAPALPALTGSGSAEAIVEGAGAPALPALAGGGAGTAPIEGTGAPSLPAMQSAGSGTVSVEGAGSPSLPALAGGGTAILGSAVAGTGSPSLPALSATGAGEVVVEGTGSPALPGLSGVGAGIVPVEGLGVPVLPALGGSGTATAPVVGTGSPQLPALAASGAGRVHVTGIGSPALPALAGSGEGTAGDFITFVPGTRAKLAYAATRIRLSLSTTRAILTGFPTRAEVARMPFHIKEGDLSVPIQVRLINGDGSTLDLTGATVTFSMMDDRGNVVIDAKPANILSVSPPANPDAPNVEYAWAATETDKTGKYRGEFVVTSGGKEGTFPGDRFLEILIGRRVS